MGVVDVNGDVLLEDEDISYADGEGIYVDDELIYEESIFNSDRAYAAAIASELAGAVEDGEAETDGTAISEETGTAEGVTASEDAGDMEAYEDTENAEDAESAESAYKNTVLLVTPEEKQAQLTLLLGESILLTDSQTGEVTEYVTVDIINGKYTKVSDAQAAESAKASKAALEENLSKDSILLSEYLEYLAGDGYEAEREKIEYTPLSIQAGFKKLMESDESGGVWLIVAAALFGAAVMAAIYFGAIRRKEEQ